MVYYTKSTDRMDIHIEESRGTILIKQKWRYFWLNSIETSSWTYSEKQDFHKKVDNLIWNNWGQYFFLKVKGGSGFAKKHVKTRWNVNFDIEWVLHTEHWKVNVKKIVPNSYERSNVAWSNKEINIDTEDVSWRKRVRDNKKYFQYPLVHEFGHAVGNSIFASKGMHGDEYSSSSNHIIDKHSLMNIGNKLRDRHLDYILSQLNTMIPNTSFEKN